MTIYDSSHRLKQLDGTFNLRDVGGYSAATGRTRWGKLFRSDALHQLTGADRQILTGLGIRTIIDLRDDAEREHAPSAIDGLEVDVVSNPIFSKNASAYIASDISLEDLYRDVVAKSGAALVAAIRYIAASGDDPVLVHCTAGKDRTGLVVALALLAAGVKRDEVVADYALTENNLPKELMGPIIERLRAEYAPDSLTIAELIAGSPAPVLERTIDLLIENYGSVTNYLLANGLTSKELADLKRALVETPNPGE
jgi:protein-tyrosine phosphatase